MHYQPMANERQELFAELKPLVRKWTQFTAGRTYVAIVGLGAIGNPLISIMGVSKDSIDQILAALVSKC